MLTVKTLPTSIKENGPPRAPTEKEVLGDQEGDEQCSIHDLEDEQRHMFSQEGVWC